MDTIKDLTNQSNANLTMPPGNNLADNNNIIIDNIIPTIVDISSNIPDGAYKVIK